MGWVTAPSEVTAKPRAMSCWKKPNTSAPLETAVMQYFNFMKYRVLPA